MPEKGNKMKIKKEVVAAGVPVFVLFLLLAVVGFRGIAAKPASAKNSRIVMRVNCDQTSASLFSSDGSASAPPVTATTCAQAIADLLNVNFELATAENSAGGFLSTYTLVAAKSVSASQSQNDVMRFACADFTNQVQYQDGSASAPTVSALTCAQAIADLLNVDFELASTEADRNTQSKVYTLVRK
jgi:hypothetical protein